MGTFIGPLIGAAVFLLLENLVSLWTVHWQLIVGAVFVICVLFFPRGIWGTFLHQLRRRVHEPEPAAQRDVGKPMDAPAASTLRW
jgi:hypothetical protein